MDINIALLPEARLGAVIADLSAQLVPVGNTLVLEPGADAFPHLTLYLTGFEDDCVATLLKLVQANISHLPIPALRLSGAVVSPKGTVLLPVEKTAELDHLHRWMIHKLNPFRMRARPGIWEARRGCYGPQELDRLERLGYPHSLDAWSPHFTLGKVAPERAAEAKALIDSAELQGKAACIGIGTVGPHGTFSSLLGECLFAPA